MTNKIATDMLSTAAQVDDYSSHLLLTINLAKAGWAPGNTHVYVISQSGRTLSIGPTHFFKYRWEEFAWLTHCPN